MWPPVLLLLGLLVRVGSWLGHPRRVARDSNPNPQGPSLGRHQGAGRERSLPHPRALTTMDQGNGDHDYQVELELRQPYQLQLALPLPLSGAEMRRIRE